MNCQSYDTSYHTIFGIFFGTSALIIGALRLCLDVGYPRIVLGILQKADGGLFLLLPCAEAGSVLVM